MYTKTEMKKYTRQNQEQFKRYRKRHKQSGRQNTRNHPIGTAKRKTNSKKLKKD